MDRQAVHMAWRFQQLMLTWRVRNDGGVEMAEHEERVAAVTGFVRDVMRSKESKHARS